ncbi:hypothetical protein [Corynebacterium cystitidis]|nr:hypothetical protein [Corynebacterium cystitidis]
MTRLLLKLHRTLWWRNVKNNVSVAMIAVLIILYTLLGLVSIGLAMSTELSSGKWHALTAAVAIGTGAYALAAMVFPNGENQISPAQLAAQPVTSRDVLPAMGWASVLSSRGIAAVIATVVTTGVATAMFAGAGRPLAAVAAIPLMLVALLTTVVLGELVASFNRGGTRRSKELTNVITLVVGFGVIFGFNYLMGSMVEIPLSSYGRYLAWTPLAAAPGTLASAMHGAWLAATVQLLIAVATAVGGIYLWRFWTVRELTAPLDVRRDNTTDTSRAAEEVARSLLLP